MYSRYIGNVIFLPTQCDLDTGKWGRSGPSRSDLSTRKELLVFEESCLKRHSFVHTRAREMDARKRISICWNEGGVAEVPDVETK
jgi:hypothetical protein